uniref:Polymerase nucleotidyl transferase domain-containing protein n=1 Tax=viral metagenome TaxID=1070528 RepID=A0A6C0LJA2_9ZZZZ
MTIVQNNINEETQLFLDKLSNAINAKLYLFGSVLTSDYYPNKSDIDIDIFSDNIATTKYNLYAFLNSHDDNSKKDIVFKKFVFVTNKDKIINGIKTSYKNKENHIFLELNIFDTTMQEYVLNERRYKQNFPVYITFLYSIIKFCHYELNLISVDNYRYLKELCLNYLMGGKKIEFVNLEI